MATWYVGSVQYAAVAQWAASTAYTVGQIVRQLATPAVGAERCFRCTTAGTSGGSEPTWNTIVAGQNTTSGTAVFTDCTGNATYNWSAPFYSLAAILNTTGWAAAGDTIYIAHDSNATRASAWNANSTLGSSTLPIKIMCVNAAGSVPPVAADLRYTAVENTTGANDISMALTSQSIFMSGVTFNAGSAANAASINLHASASSAGKNVFSRCAFVLNNTSASSVIAINNSAATIVFDNSTVTFGAVGQSIRMGNGNFFWRNTATAIGGATFPTSLFTSIYSGQATIVVDGVDLSALGSGKNLVNPNNGGAGAPGSGAYSFVNCKLGASVALSSVAPPTAAVRSDIVISDSGATGYRQESSQFAGTLTSNTTYTRVGGASDGVQALSWAMVSNANNNPVSYLECFPLAAWNAVTGSTVTATVEIESNATLTNADIVMELQYLGTSGYPIASVVTTAPGLLATPSNLPTSSATWNGSLGSAVKQYLQVTFTPQMAGLVRARIFIAKASQTIYVDPVITLT